MKIWHTLNLFYSLFETNWIHEPKRIFSDEPITALTRNYSVNLERIFLTIPLWEREFCQIFSHMNACPPHQNLDWWSCVAHCRSMWCTQKTQKNTQKKGKESFTWAIWGSWSFSLITVMPEVRIGSQTGTKTWVSLLTASDTCEGHAENVIYEYLA